MLRNILCFKSVPFNYSNITSAQPRADPYHAVIRSSSDYVHALLLTQNGCWYSASGPGCFIPGGKPTCTEPLVRRLNGPQKQSKCHGREKEMEMNQQPNSFSSNPQVSLYTD